MNRRGFILLGTGAIAAVSVPSYFLLYKTEYDPTLAVPKSLALIWNKDEMKSIGEQYIQKSDENGERTLVKAILNGHDKKQSFNEFIDQKTKEDFQSGNVVTVDGWVLSVTEARQCALQTIAKS